MHCIFVAVPFITSNTFEETEVKILELGCDRKGKHDSIHRSNTT